MGAHPSAPSGLARPPASPPAPPSSPSPAPPAPVTTSASSVTLNTVIAADPDDELGPEYAARFGGRLPFLLKVLSAAKALSIQVHPSRAQAEAGFAAENARGLAPGDPARNYVDDWPKPELLYALTPFEMAAGLRSPSDAAALLRALAVDELKPLAARLDAGLAARLDAGLAAGLAAGLDAGLAAGLDAGLDDAAGEDALGAALAAVLEWPEPAPLVAAVVAACQRLADAGDRYAGGRYADACAAAVRVAADHPGDIGVVALLLMRHEVLQPGQAVFMPAGGLHAYLRGTGIELLANSDNVVRSGLTGKHIDVPELLKLLDPSVAVPVLTPHPVRDGITTFDTPAPEFRLYLINLPAPPALALPGTGPRILLCLDGACSLRAASGSTLDLTRGDSCFIPFADGPVHATGPARLALATPGDLAP